jgi:hypothetical protein
MAPTIAALRIRARPRAFINALLATAIAVCAAGILAPSAGAVSTGNFIGTLSSSTASGANVAGQTASNPLGSTVLPLGVTYDSTNSRIYVALAMGVNNGKVAQVNGAAVNGGFASMTVNERLGFANMNFFDDVTWDGTNVLAANFCSRPASPSADAGRICNGSTQTAAYSSNAGAAGSVDFLTTSTCQNPASVVFAGTNGGSAATWVTCAGSGRVYFRTGTTNTTLQLNAGDSVPSGLDVTTTAANGPNCAQNPNDRQQWALVADARNNLVRAFYRCTSGGAAATMVQGNSVALASGCKPARLAIDPRSSTVNNVYVTCPGTGTLTAFTFNPTTGAFGAIPAGGTRTLPGTSPAPYGVAVNSADTGIVVTDPANDQAVIYRRSPTVIGTDLTNAAVSVATVSTGANSDPNGVAIAGTSVNAFVANQTSGTITVVDPPAAIKAEKACKAAVRKAKRSTRGQRKAVRHKAIRRAQKRACRGLKISYKKKARAKRSSTPQERLARQLSRTNPLIYPGDGGR